MKPDPYKRRPRVELVLNRKTADALGVTERRSPARAMSGHVAAAPPRSVMNSRRLIFAPKLRRQHPVGSNEYFNRAETGFGHRSVKHG
jgi:hypothetical protein